MASLLLVFVTYSIKHQPILNIYRRDLMREMGGCESSTQEFPRWSQNGSLDRPNK